MDLTKMESLKYDERFFLLGSKTETAKKLGISRPTLDRWIKEYRNHVMLRDAEKAHRELHELRWVVSQMCGMSADELIKEHEAKRQKFLDSIGA